MAQNRQDMGSGPVKPLLLQLMIPAVVAQVVNLLYNIVDRIYIGHIEGIGAAALTGVGLFAPILMLLNAFAMLIGAGGAPRTAIALGQGNKDEAEKIIGNSFTVLLFFAVVLTAGFYAGAPALLRLFGASDATLPYAVAYGRIYILGSVFVLLVMGMNPFITTQGFAKISMLTTVIGAVINIILDPILIFGLGWGVRGAAVATVLSQAVGACWILKFLTGPKTILKLRKENLKVERNIILPVLGLGISTAAKNQFLACQFAIMGTFMPALMLSGFLYDILNMPPAVRAITCIIPARYYVTLLQTLFLAGDIPSVIIPCCITLGVFAVALMGIARLKAPKSLE